MIGLAFLIMAAAVSVTLLSARLAAKLSRILREKVFEKVMSFTNSEFDKFSTASLITRSTNDIQQIQMFMTMVFRIGRDLAQAAAQQRKQQDDGSFHGAFRI